MNKKINQEKVIAEFKLRRQRHIIALFPFSIAFLLTMGIKNPNLNFLNIAPANLGTFSIIIVIVVLIFSYRNWRCPACNQYLGKGLNPTRCEKCGAKFK